jgi:peroxiredoxin
MTTQPDYRRLPNDLARPEDDGAAAHLAGARVPPVELASTSGEKVDLSALPGRTVVYAYPMTGVPGVPLPPGWDDIPGARGCTPESLGFKDHAAELLDVGACVFGLSTQDTAYQQEMAERLHLPFAVLSDAELRLARAMRLPTMQVEGRTLLKRLTLVLRDGAVEHVLYPVFPPDQAAAAVLARLRA